MRRFSRSSRQASLAHAVFALGVGILSMGSGCAAIHHASNDAWPGHSQIRAKGPARSEPSAQQTRPDRTRRDASFALAERAMRRQGVTFGTDGSPEAIYAYATMRHKTIAPREAGLGDLVFFDHLSRGEKENCGSHVGVVVDVAPNGAITFKEHRDGQLRKSVLHPEWTRHRRDPQGRVINSFLRPKLKSDPVGTRYYAGEMLCRVIRVKSS
jgi:hypothetical protein